MAGIMTSRRSIYALIGLLAFFASTLAFTSAASAMPPAKVDVCHLEDDGTYIMVNVSERALEAFVRNGGGQPGDAVSGMPGFEFDESCQPELNVVAPAGCYLLSDFGGLLLSYITTDGSLVGQGSLLPRYTDSDCTNSSGEWGGTFVITWATDAAQAQAQCEAASGSVAAVEDRTNFTPNLWLCVLAS